ncbi:MAG: hypothetical protein ACFFAY_10290, partial [Promethearchaeota archaeon]
DTLEVSSHVMSESGNFTFGISSYFGLWWLDEFHTGNSTDIVDGREATHGLNISMDWVRGSTDKWIVQSRLALEVRLLSFASIVIESVTVKARSSESLYPLTIDFQDKTGQSLYNIRETRWLTEIPVANLTGVDRNRTAALIQWFPYETVYVPMDIYSVEYGWLSAIILSSITYIEFREIGRFDSSVTMDLGKLFLIRMNVIRLDVEMNQDVLLNVHIEGPSYLANLSSIYYLYWISNYMPDARITTFYIPDDIELLEVLIVLNVPGYPRFQTLAEVTGSNHLSLNAHFPFHSVFGIAFDIVQLFLILLTISLLVAMYVSLRRSLHPLPLTSWIRRERFLPTLLLVLSYILPWTSTKVVMSSSKGPLTVWKSLFLPIGVEATTAGQGDMVLTLFGIEYAQRMESLSDIWNAAGFFPIVLLLFWLPMVIVLYQYIHDKPMKFNLWTILPVATPALVGIIVVFTATSGQILLGFAPAFLSLIVVFLLGITRTDKWNNVARHVGR